MQQTDQYQLNLIEKDDTFSPDPLNENTRKLEEALRAAREAGDAEAAAREQVCADLTRRVAALEGHKIAAGTYKSTGSSQTISVGFYPRAVITHGDSGGTYLATRDGSGFSGYLVLTGNGFTVSGYANQGGTHTYLALC